MTNRIAVAVGVAITSSAFAGLSNVTHAGTVGVSATATVNGPWGWNVGDAPSQVESSTPGANFAGLAEVNAQTVHSSGTARAAYSQIYRNDGFSFQSALSALTSPGPNAPVTIGASSHLQMEWTVSDSAALSLAGTSATDGVGTSSYSYVSYVFYRYLDLVSSDLEIVSQSMPSAGSPVNFTATVSSGRYGMVVWHDLQVGGFGSRVATSSAVMEFQIVSIPSPASAAVLAIGSFAFGAQARRCRVVRSERR